MVALKIREHETANEAEIQIYYMSNSQLAQKAKFVNIKKANRIGSK